MSSAAHKVPDALHEETLPLQIHAAKRVGLQESLQLHGSTSAPPLGGR